MVNDWRTEILSIFVFEKILLLKKLFVILLFALSSSLLNLCSAQFTVMHNFNDTNGGGPQYGSLTLSGNVLYGMTAGGGVCSNGVVFSINNINNNYKDIYDFNCYWSDPNHSEGYRPWGSLTLSGNMFYGTTWWGANFYRWGNIFSIDTNGGGYNDLLELGSPMGANPEADLTLSSNTLFGMAQGGNGDGTIFSINTNGSNPKTLLSFNGTNGYNVNGNLTHLGGLLYGMAQGGGAYSYGCIFHIDTNGNGFKDIYDFTGGTNGGFPAQSLTLSGGVFYGMARGGVHDSGCIFSIDTNGSNYKVLFSFNYQQGYTTYYLGSLTLSGNKLFGVTPNGGAYNDGVAFSIDTNGNGFKDLYYFNPPNGITPCGALTISGGSLYGMTSAGGKDNAGVIFKLDTSAVATGNNITTTKDFINVYPNPNNGIFTLSCHSDSPAGGEESLPTIKVYNVLGQQVFNETLRFSHGDNLIELINQPSGIYLCRVIANSGNLLGEGKLVIIK